MSNQTRHQIRPYAPIFNGPVDGRPFCGVPNCPRVPLFVHIWRNGKEATASYQNELLCAEHATIVKRTHNL
jgi:hypothetical protein